MVTKGGQTTTSARAPAAAEAISWTSAPASEGALFIFQLPAMMGVRKRVSS
jgi:hypothetical protein